jgi:putative DNA primase/helicase
MIETRGERGFLIIPPSWRDTHPSGKPYVQERGGLPTIVTVTPVERETLLNVARSLHEVYEETGSENRSYAKHKESGGTRPGDLFNTRATWEEILEPHGWKKTFERAGVAYWRRPGKDRGISATTNYGGSDLLYVFSTSTDFESEHGYGKFSAYALLNHGSDFVRAAEDLLRQGYSPNGGESGHSERTSDTKGEQSAEWPEMLALPRALLPVVTFPSEILPAPLRPWLSDIAERIQCALDFPAVGAVVAIASLVGRRVGIRPKRQDD